MSRWWFTGSASPWIKYSFGMGFVVIKTQGDWNFPLWEKAREMNDSHSPMNHRLPGIFLFAFAGFTTPSYSSYPGSFIPSLHGLLNCWRAADMAPQKAWRMLLATGTSRGCGGSSSLWMTPSLRTPDTWGLGREQNVRNHLYILNDIQSAGNKVMSMF